MFGMTECKFNLVLVSSLLAADCEHMSDIRISGGGGCSWKSDFCGKNFIYQQCPLELCPLTVQGYFPPVFMDWLLILGTYFASSLVFYCALHISVRMKPHIDHILSVCKDLSDEQLVGPVSVRVFMYPLGSISNST